MTDQKKSTKHAVIATGGRQHLVSEGDILALQLMDAKVGETVTFSEVLLVTEPELKIGTPHVAGATVTASVLAHGKTAKVRGVKFHNKVRYRRTFGHRQDFTKVKIEKIA